MHTLIAVVKKTFRYSKVFSYNHLYHPYVFRNLFLKSGINNGIIVFSYLLKASAAALDIYRQSCDSIPIVANLILGITSEIYSGHFSDRTAHYNQRRPRKI
jgi:hypothetical protein